MKIRYKCHNPNLYSKGNDCDEINEAEFDISDKVWDLSSRKYKEVGFIFKHKCKKCGFEHDFELGACEDRDPTRFW